MTGRNYRIQWIWNALVLFALLAACAAPPLSTTPTVTSGYRLHVSRLFGYSSGDQIKGSFRLSVVGISDIHSVDFIIDGQGMARVDASPYQLDFQTETYSFGVHRLSASITTMDGRNVEVPDRQFEFATAQQEQKSMVGVFASLGSVILLAVALGLGLQFLFTRNKKREFVPLGTARNYGWRGGAICPKCHRPTGLHPFSPHFGLRLIYDFCDNCGKWSTMKIVPDRDLRKAEVEEIRPVEKIQGVSGTEEEKLKEILDESKYTQ